MFVIEDIPVQSGYRNYGKYPFGQMLVGQSFLCTDHIRVRASASDYGKRHGKKFSVRKEGEMYRCGRIE